MTHSIWAVVPAAGIGKRMQSDMPKQYLALNGRPVLEHTLNALLQNENISGLVISLQEDDDYWPQIKIDSQKPVLLAKGGKERADSVLNAIETLCQFDQFDESDWVMVHDAVRPCLQQKDINKLVAEIGDNQDGGLLAFPVRDTMKRQKKNSASGAASVKTDAAVTSASITAASTTAASITSAVASTVDRENLWHALTPQYFPVLTLRKALLNALHQASQGNLSITDESSSMEFAGYSPLLIHGAEDNIKITRPDDLRLASLYLQAHDLQLHDLQEQNNTVTDNKTEGTNE